jgi:hypothetical protein
VRGKFNAREINLIDQNYQSKKTAFTKKLPFSGPVGGATLTTNKIKPVQFTNI